MSFLGKHSFNFTTSVSFVCFFQGIPFAFSSVVARYDSSFQHLLNSFFFSFVNNLSLSLLFFCVLLPWCTSPFFSAIHIKVNSYRYSLVCFLENEAIPIGVFPS